MMKKVNKYHSGRAVLSCPNCEKHTIVGHMSWVSLQCPHCTRMTVKCDWLVVKGTEEGDEDAV